MKAPEPGLLAAALLKALGVVVPAPMCGRWDSSADVPTMTYNRQGLTQLYNTLSLTSPTEGVVSISDTVFDGV